METGKPSKTGTQLAKITDVPSALDLINAKIEKLKFIQETVYKTKTALVGFSKVEDMLKVEDIIKVYSAIKTRSDTYYAAAIELGIKNVPVFKLEGCTDEEWKADCQLRMANIQYKETLEKLQSVKLRYENLMTEADKMKILEKELMSIATEE